MGTLGGHILPGSFFLGFGLWWVWAMYHRYFICRRNVSESLQTSKKGKKELRYVNTSTYRCTCFCSNIQVEGVIKVVATTIGFIGELVTAFNKDGEFVNLVNGQHMAMYFFFGINGFLDIMQFHGFSLFPDMDYLSGILALLIEVFLFWNHLHGRSPMDVQIHVYLVYAVMGCIIAAFCEMRHRNSPLPALARIFFTILQGTWFYQVGFILYPPSGNTWDEDSHEQMMITTIIFTCHCAGIFIFMSIAAVLVHLRIRRMEQAIVYEVLQSHSHTNERIKSTKYNEDHIRNIITDSDEEVDTGI